MWRYSMSAFARQVVALLDHLELDQAIVGGTSLGANITLEVASLAPERLRGMLIEMPVLDNAIPACGAAFTPLLFALTFGEPVMTCHRSRGSRGAARAGSVRARARARLARAGPAASAAVLQGILFGRTAPDRTERKTFQTPALVIGHPRDPVHPFSDADMLAAELPNARLIDANSIVELRLKPARLTAEDRRVRRGVLARGAHLRRAPAFASTRTAVGHRADRTYAATGAAGGPGGSTMSRPVGCSARSSSSCQK